MEGYTNRLANQNNKIIKRLSNFSLIILSIFLLIPYPGNGQVESSGDSSRVKLLIAAREIIGATGICTLITLDEYGVPRARAMDAFLPDSNFIVWFGTNPDSRKVKQVQRDPRVTLYYFDPESSSYVLIYGKAELIDNAAEKKLYWKPAWHAFYPNYPDGYKLIKVTPEWLEVVSASRGITGDPLTWQPPIVWFNKQ